jgi:hypothetical protein
VLDGGQCAGPGGGRFLLRGDGHGGRIARRHVRAARTGGHARADEDSNRCVADFHC